MHTEQVSVKLLYFNHLTQLSTPENFIEWGRPENFKASKHVTQEVRFATAPRKHRIVLRFWDTRKNYKLEELQIAWLGPYAKVVDHLAVCMLPRVHQ